MAGFLMLLLDLCCFTLNCVLLSVPLYDIYEIYYSKETDKYPYSYLLFSSYNCYVWFIYGFKESKLALEWSCFYGTIVNIFCLIVFILSTQLYSYTKHILNSCFILTFVILIVLEFYLEISPHIYGLTGCIIEVIVAISTVQKIQEAILYRDIRYIPIRIVVIFFLANISLLLYAYILSDIYLTIPNLVAFTCNSYQIYLYFLFSQKSNKIIDVPIEMKIRSNDIGYKFNLLDDKC